MLVFVFVLVAERRAHELDTFSPMPIRPLALLALLAALALPAGAQRLGTLDFPTSGAADAQKHFVTGVLYLHSFEYPSALKEFREAERLDPGFAMAYWGEAMTYTHPVWDQQDADAARAALAKLAPTPAARLAKAPTDREKAYLRAVDILYGTGTKPARDTAYAAAMAERRRPLSEGCRGAALLRARAHRSQPGRPRHPHVPARRRDRRDRLRAPTRPSRRGALHDPLVR